jgi:hypothetical protein
MQRVFRGLEQRGIVPNTVSALEVFGMTGKYHTLDYAERVKSLEVWEIDPELEDALHRNLPGANVLIVDSYAYAQICKDRFGMIVVDNPLSMHGSHCEHFDLFPHIFRLAEPGGLLVVNVIPRSTQRASKRFPYLFDETQLAARSAFYTTDTPEDIAEAEIVLTYHRLARDVGREIEWSFWIRRHFMYYLVLGLTKMAPITKVERT